MSGTTISQVMELVSKLPNMEPMTYLNFEKEITQILKSASPVSEERTEQTKQRRTRKSKNDGEKKPKMNGFLLFKTEKKSELAKELEGKQAKGATAKLAADWWSDISKAEQEEYKERAKKMNQEQHASHEEIFNEVEQHEEFVVPPVEEECPPPAF